MRVRARAAGNGSGGHHRPDFLRLARDPPRASGNNALAHLPLSTRAAHVASGQRGPPHSFLMTIACVSPSFDMSSRANSSDISLPTVSCIRTADICRVLDALKQIAGMPWFGEHIAI